MAKKSEIFVKDVSINNPAFKGVEFDPLLAEAGSNAAKQWREANPDLKGNIRDYATINELI